MQIIIPEAGDCSGEASVVTRCQQDVYLCHLLTGITILCVLISLDFRRFKRQSDLKWNLVVHQSYRVLGTMMLTEFLSKR